MKKNTKKESYHHGSLQDEALVVALKIIQKKGIEDLTLREMAKELGTSATALYRHFENKEAILAAIAQNGFEKLLSSIHEKLTEEKFETNLFQIALLFVNFAQKNESQFRVMFNKEISKRKDYPDLIKLTGELVKILKENIQGLLCKKNNVDSQAYFFWAQLHGLCLLLLEEQLPSQLNREDFIGKQIQFLLKCLKTGS